MIDLHCHILPQVDDGSESLVESMAMIDIAYNDGIRTIVATPHRNHPVDFRNRESIEETFQLLVSKVKNQYPDMKLYLGSELFVSKDFLEVLDDKPYNLTINGSRYVLIEFDVSASFSFIQSAIHELLVRGYIPILAHVEYYEALFDQFERIRTLKDEGVAIQVTSSNLIGKNGLKMQSFIKRLIAMGMVDFVSSDAHRSTYRRPLLKDAYNLTASWVGDNEAQRIFIDNQQAVIDNESLLISNIRTMNQVKSSNRHLNRYLAIAAILVLAGVIFIITSGGINGWNDSGVEPTTTGNTEGNTETTIARTEESSEAIETAISGEETSAFATEQSSEKATNPSKEAIEEAYLDRLLTYQQEYEDELDRIVGLIKEAREVISDDNERKRVVEGYLGDIINLEEQADIRVYQALYELQNELESYRYDVSIVQEMRDEYHRIKEEKTQYYLNQI
ncbi:MAG TPA: hypothetical protein DCG34_07805 [Clostridiales bacterium]|jgi:protein-tyrosine phosphatase|nr:hypothetical protein [Clostridiales bacterium]